MLRMNPRRSPRWIDQTANWQVNELVMRITVATRISDSGFRIPSNSAGGHGRFWALVEK